MVLYLENVYFFDTKMDKDTKPNSPNILANFGFGTSDEIEEEVQNSTVKVL